MKITYQAISDVGRKRKGNEDHYLVNPDQRLFVVADGMGGHAAGEVASRIAVEAIEDFVRQTRVDGSSALPWGHDAPITSETDRIREAVVYSNGMVFDATRERAEYEGMATTIAAVLVDGAMVHVAHVGDSRVYLFRRNHMKQMTRDHSWVNEQVENGVLTPEQARVHPLRNVVTRALGGQAELTVDVTSLEVRPDDVLLLCSDGLTTMVSDEEIVQILEEERGALPEAARKLVEAANASGGEDNVTIVLVQFQA